MKKVPTPRSRMIVLWISLALSGAILIGKSLKMLYPVDWRLLIAAILIIAGTIFIPWRIDQE
jgi:hypothetical protein